MASAVENSSSSNGQSTGGCNGDVYNLERCEREGFLRCKRQDAGQEDKSRKAAVGNGTGGASSVPLMALNATKAGMEGLDLVTINKRITELSEGSKFYEHKKKQQEKIDKKIVEIKREMQRLTAEQIAKAQEEVDKLVSEIEGDLNHYYVHIDMDAFFASVEMRDDPSLKEVPMAVGSDSMLSTSNYRARKFGVRAAMPGFIARKLCPQLKIVPCNFKKYEEASKVVEKSLKEYDENLFMCMDEADLDITSLVLSDPNNANGKMSKSIAWDIVEAMRKKIETATNLTASAGIAPTRFLAKLCSDMQKPNGQCALSNDIEAIKAFMSFFPIRKVCGIGNVTEQMLKAIDIETCKDLWDKRAILSLLFKRATFQNLLGIAMGTGSSVFRDITAASGGRKSLSCERTFTGTSDLSFLENLCKNLCSEVEKDLKAVDLSCKTITLKIKTTDYDVKTRARSIMARTNSAEKIFESAWKIYMSYLQDTPELTIRLMGVRVSNLSDANKLNNQRTMDQFLRDPSSSNNAEAGEDDSSSDDDDELDPFQANLESSKKYVKCPICQKRFSKGPDFESAMSVHIDECLNGPILQGIRLERMLPSSSPKKRSSSGKATNAPKKAKRGGGSSALPITAFFNKL